MSQSPYLTVREASQILNITEGHVMQLIEEHKLQAYRIADQYLRLKRSDVHGLRDSGDIASETVRHAYTTSERLRDALVYNDFYILSFFIIAVLLMIVLSGQ